MYRKAVRNVFCSLLPGVMAAWLTTGCGRETTETDCQLIADRIIELELRASAVTDANEIRRKRNETLGLGSEAGRKALLEGCIGRRIREGALECVRAAQTADEITDKCLR